MKCNICDCDEFIAMGTREGVRCKQCDSLERTRLLWMYLNRLDLSSMSKVLHLAPEKGICEALQEILPYDSYITADIEPRKYPFARNITKIDLCKLDSFPSREYELIIHSHVLEHVPCNIAYTLYHLHRMLQSDGLHICVIPFMKGKYDECFQDISDDERSKRFGQFDHVRRIGSADIDKHVGNLLDIPGNFDATAEFSTEELIAANIPHHSWTGFTADTVLHFKRNDMKLLNEKAYPLSS